MTTSQTQFVTDETGEHVAVLIGLDRYRQLLDVHDEIDAIRGYDDARASGDEAISFDETAQEIERERKGAGSNPSVVYEIGSAERRRSSTSGG